MAGPIDVIAFDGDDTLWHTESLFVLTETRVARLLAPYVEERELRRRLLEVERRNLHLFGYGIKGFMLSLIETAIEVTAGRVTAAEIHGLIGLGKEMLRHPVELLEAARDTVERLSSRHRVMLVTKGDLFDQESKIARSGLGDLFWRIEIVSEKDEPTYRRIMSTCDVAPDAFLMVGNSVRSDVLPVLAAGARAVHVPYHVTWAHEEVAVEDHPKEGFPVLDSLAGLPALVDRLSRE